jgi:hypothetical protein
MPAGRLWFGFRREQARSGIRGVVNSPGFGAPGLEESRHDTPCSADQLRSDLLIGPFSSTRVGACTLHDGYQLHQALRLSEPAQQRDTPVDRGKARKTLLVSWTTSRRFLPGPCFAGIGEGAAFARLRWCPASCKGACSLSRRRCVHVPPCPPCYAASRCRCTWFKKEGSPL